MKRLIFLVTALAFLVSGSLAMARRDANREALNQQWKQQQVEQKKIAAQLKAGESEITFLPGDLKAVPVAKKAK